MFVPDFMPDIKHGYQPDPAVGGCVMQVTNYLYDGGWSDKPSCTDEGLANIAITVNDCVDTEARRGLLAAVPDLIDTAFVEISPEREDEAIDALNDFASETFPYGDLDDEGCCEECESRWACLVERLEMAIGVACCMSGPIPGLEKYLGSWTGQMDDHAALSQHYGTAVADAIVARPPDYLARQHELVAWFLTFLHKYREVMGINEPPREITESDWRQVAEYMTPA